MVRCSAPVARSYCVDGLANEGKLKPWRHRDDLIFFSSEVSLAWRTN